MYSNFPGARWYGYDDDEDELDVTDDRDDFYQYHEPEDDPYDDPAADYIYDPLSRKGFE